MRYLFLFLGLSLCCFFPLAAGAESRNELPLPTRPLELNSVQADFIQEKELKILARPLISTGSFTFQAPQSLRWEYLTPVRSILLMHGGKVRKFIERDGVFTEEQGMQLDAMQVVLAEISSWLDGRFSDNAMFKVSFPNEQTVLLTPKQEGLAALISGIELTLSDQAGLLDRVVIFEGPDSFTSLTFSNRIINREIPAKVFSER